MTTTAPSSTPLGEPSLDGSWRTVARRALSDAAPLIAGYLPFGFVLGATIADSQVPDLAGLASSPLVFAGAAQLAMIELLSSGAGLAVVVATALVINARHLMYSGAIAPWFIGMPTAFRVAAPHLMVDPVYSFAAVRFPQLPDTRARMRYWLALGLTIWAAWTAMTAAGIVLGARLPDTVDLSLAVPLVFLALLVPTVVDRPTLAAATTGGLVTVAASGLPLHLGLLVGALSGVAVGVALDGAAPDASRGESRELA